MDESHSATAPMPRAAAKGPDPLLGRIINERYKVVSIIARGGMGKVYLAEQASLGRRVALKVLDPKHSGEDEPEFHQRFFLEASLTSKLTHPNTVTVFDYGKTDDDVYYIVMELLEGRTLYHALRDGAFTPERTVHIALQVTRALREAHGLGIVHRDLKPANIFLVRHGDESDFVKVLDFGLVKNVQEKADDQLTKAGVFLGSPKYMAPEQIRGERVDGRADVYALGVLMFEMLTGKVPFERSSSVNTLMAHLHDAVPPLSELNPGLDAPQLEPLVRRCLAKAPDERFASMNDVHNALMLAIGQRPTASGIFPARDTGARSVPAPPPASAAPVGPASHTPSSVTPASSAPFAHASKGSGNAVPLFLAALFALTGIAGFLVLNGRLEAVEQPAAQTQEPVQKPAAPTAEPTAPAPNRAVLVTLRSSPPGATVIVDGKEYGPTPTHALLTGAAAALGREVAFTFRRRGFRAVTILRTLDGTRLDVESGRMEPATGKRSGPAD